jgi:hypothetical protein
MRRFSVLCVSAIFAMSLPVRGQDSASHCGGAQKHHAQVNERGDHVMGFSHDTTTHHFRLTQDGGEIEVSANDPKDSATIEAIQGHLAHIATKFADGDFEAPMLIHDRVPPGVPVMQRDQAKIDWKYEDTDAGGRVVVSSKDADDRKAIHEFLRFQIEDHQTGDSTEVPAAR